MPTVYDILPTLEKEVIKLLHGFMKEDDGSFHLWEIAILLPASNAFLHYLDGINVALKSDNYVSATANLRGLIESLGAIVYDGTAKLPKEGYDRFLKTGRLPKWDEKKNKWVDLGARESARYAQMVVDPKIKLTKVYDDCCDLLHFSSTHMSFLGGLKPQNTGKENLASIKIGAKDNIPLSTQKQVIQLCAELTTALGQCISAATDEKSVRKSKREK